MRKATVVAESLTASQCPRVRITLHASSKREEAERGDVGCIILVTQESIIFFIPILWVAVFGPLWGIQENELPNAIIFSHQQSCKHGSGEET